jgi:hypothetical protein
MEVVIAFCTAVGATKRQQDSKKSSDIKSLKPFPFLSEASNASEK